MCAVHGEGCSTLIKHKHDPSQIVGIYLMEAGIIFHSGARLPACLGAWGWGSWGWGGRGWVAMCLAG
jgi:hypothetical protein